jgi:hypothetical protein
MAATDYIPEVWHTPGRPPILVCGKRWLRGEHVRGAGIKTTWESISHVVAIGIGEEPQIYFGHRGLPDCDEVWTRDQPETHGIDSHAAALALAEGWACVEAKIDLADFSFTATLKDKRLKDFRGGTHRRNIGIFLRWRKWESDQAPIAARLAEVHSWGFQMTAKAFRRLIEDSGL